MDGPLYGRQRFNRVTLAVTVGFMSDMPPLASECPPATPVAAEIHCPNCGYNLSGTNEDRCSECGQSFDRATLIEWTTDPRQRLPLGSLSQPGDNTLRLSLFDPARLGRLLPPHPDVAAVKAYSRVVRLLAVVGAPLVLTSTMAIITGEAGFFSHVLPALPLPLLIAPLACESLIAVLLARFVEPGSVPRPDWYPFWRTLCRLFASYLLITVSLVCLLIILAVVLIELMSSSNPVSWIVPTLPFWIPVGMVLWWWHGLGQAIAARGAPCTARTVIILFIPAIALAAIALGLGITMLEVFIFPWLL